MTTCGIHRSYSGLHPAMRRERTSFWSRHDPVMLQLGSTDHWAQMRTRAELLGRPKTADPGLAQNPPTRTSQQGFESGEATRRMKNLGCHGDGRVDPRGVAVFSEVRVRDQHGAGPDNYTLVRPKSSPNRCQLRTSYNEKARQGYKYWYQDRPKPTSFGKYGIGSYKTVLGLGNGPRT